MALATLKIMLFLILAIAPKGVLAPAKPTMLTSAECAETCHHLRKFDTSIAIIDDDISAEKSMIRVFEAKIETCLYAHQATRTQDSYGASLMTKMASFCKDNNSGMARFHDVDPRGEYSTCASYCTTLSELRDRFESSAQQRDDMIGNRTQIAVLLSELCAHDDGDDWEDVEAEMQITAMW